MSNYDPLEQSIILNEDTSSWGDLTLAKYEELPDAIPPPPTLKPPALIRTDGWSSLQTVHPAFEIVYDTKETYETWTCRNAFQELAVRLDDESVSNNISEIHTWFGGQISMDDALMALLHYHRYGNQVCKGIFMKFFLDPEVFFDITLSKESLLSMFMTHYHSLQIHAPPKNITQ